MDEKRPRLARAVDVDALLVAAGPGPDLDRWGRDMEEADRISGDRRPGDAPATPLMALEPENEPPTAR